MQFYDIIIYNNYIGSKKSKRNFCLLNIHFNIFSVRAKLAALTGQPAANVVRSKQTSYLQIRMWNKQKKKNKKKKKQTMITN